MDKNQKLYIAGHTGLFGAALVQCAKQSGFCNIVGRTHRELDLLDQKATLDFFHEEKPSYVIVAAALVGGIAANQKYMADFCMQNLQITCNILDAAHKTGVEKLLYLGSSCIYPVHCEQPIKESSILKGECEPTNEGYAIAKIAGIRLCEYYQKQYGDHFISSIPANVYGPNDCFDEEKAHVVPAMLLKFHRAKVKNLPYVTLWGSGKAEREFLYIDDAAKGCIDLLENYDGIGAVNIGVGKTTTILQLAQLVKKVVGYEGEMRFDPEKPDGMPRRLLDSTTAKQYGIQAEISLEEGLRRTYGWYLDTLEESMRVERM